MSKVDDINKSIVFDFIKCFFRMKWIISSKYITVQINFFLF